MRWKLGQALDPNYLSDRLLALGASCAWVDEPPGEPSLQLAPNQLPDWRGASLYALCQNEANLDKLLLQLAQNHPELGAPHISHPDLCRAVAGVPALLQFGRLRVYTSLQAAKTRAKGRQNSVDGKQAVTSDKQTRADDKRAATYGRQATKANWAANRPGKTASPAITIPAGLAFGTGTHPTTSMVLNWCQAYPLKGVRLLDYGCGTAILALAGLRLGAASAVAVDNDPQALQAASTNAEINNLQLGLQTPDTFAAGRPMQANVILANILLSPLMELQPLFTRHAAAGAKLLLTGILNPQRATLAQVYQPGWRTQEHHSSHGWCLLVLEKTS